MKEKIPSYDVLNEDKVADIIKGIISDENSTSITFAEIIYKVIGQINNNPLYHDIVNAVSKAIKNDKALNSFYIHVEYEDQMFSTPTRKYFERFDKNKVHIIVDDLHIIDNGKDFEMKVYARSEDTMKARLLF